MGENLEEKIDKLLLLHSKTDTELQELKTQVSKLSGAGKSESTTTFTPQNPSETEEQVSGETAVVTGAQASTPSPPVSADSFDYDYEAEFQTISDSVQRVKLDPSLKVKITRQGISGPQKTTLNVVTKCAKYAEVSIKCLSLLRPNEPVSESDLERLCSIQVTQVRALQDEMAALVVDSQFDPQASKFFRLQQKNSSLFSEKSLNTLEKSVTISAAMSRGNNRGNSKRGGRHSSFFRGGNRGSYSGFQQRGRYSGIYNNHNNNQREQEDDG